jgi:hypothetical protein
LDGHEAQQNIAPPGAAEVSVAFEFPAPPPPLVSVAAPAPAPPVATLPTTQAIVAVPSDAPTQSHTVRNVVSLTAAGLAVAALGTGIVFSTLATKSNEDAGALRAQLDPKTGDSACAKSSTETCTQLHQAQSNFIEQKNVATIAYASAGALVVVAVVSYFVIPGETRKAAWIPRPTFFANRNGGGFVATGTF